METLTALKMAHTAATAIMFGCALGLGIWVWQTRRSGDATAAARTLQRPRLFVWLLMGLAYGLANGAGVLAQRNPRQVAASEVVALGAGLAALAFF